MLPYLGWFIAFNQRALSVKRLTDVELQPPEPAMLDAVQEIGIYIHRFHNLDLFQQGWYQIRITIRWEEDDQTVVGIPSRVVQYEAPNLGAEDSYGIWRIDDANNSFSTSPFKIRYARQDVLLSVMVAFTLSVGKLVSPSRSPAIVKFELLYAPLLQKGSDLLACLDASVAAVHEFRIPPKALLGLHTYCPVYFDAFHAVLVDISVHITLLKHSVHQRKFSRVEDADGSPDGINKGSIETTPVSPEEVMVVKSLLTARDILLEETQKICRAIECNIDFTDFISQLDDAKLFGSSLIQHLGQTDSDSPRTDLGDSPNDNEKTGIFVDFRSNGLLHSLSKATLHHSAQTVGNQILYLWSTFLNFHRANKLKILEYFREVWANDRKAEWSIWMMYSKVEMPHRYVSSRGEEGSSHSRRGKVSVLRKLLDDPSQIAAARAELHRRSIIQMRINNRSIQDMQVFGDPSQVPVIMVERVINAPRRSSSGNSYFQHSELKVVPTLLSELKAVGKFSATERHQHGRVLKIVVFVHGFQGHHLDLRLVRNQWLLIDPKVECLMSEANEDRTSGDFREMGLRLAQEVTCFIKKKMDKVSRAGGGLRSIKLSFVGHSIGNVIIRTALAESIMEPYYRFLHTYVSVSGPHLGYLYSSNSLFNSGLWLLKKLKNTQCIHQLTFTDDPDLCNTFFYKLCQQKTLDNFKNIILLSSPQDGYVPYHSARIEPCQASSADFSKRGTVFLEMLNNCLDQIRCQSIEQRVFMRCDVNFNMSSHGRNLNTFIGRAAHIEFLETDIFVKFIMWSFPELFQ